MDRSCITATIQAYNEALRIADVVCEIPPLATLGVVDDVSTDKTALMVSNA
jgi:hypothetical protein